MTTDPAAQKPNVISYNDPATRVLVPARVLTIPLLGATNERSQPKIADQRYESVRAPSIERAHRRIDEEGSGHQTSWVAEGAHR
jgi:hypothetical protein